MHQENIKNLFLTPHLHTIFGDLSNRLTKPMVQNALQIKMVEKSDAYEVLVRSHGGVSKDQFEVELDHGVVSVSFKSKEDQSSEQVQEGVQVLVNEHVSQNEVRRWDFGHEISHNPEDHSSEFKDGVLVIHLKKAGSHKPNLIQIK